jgi:hypothetical protein
MGFIEALLGGRVLRSNDEVGTMNDEVKIQFIVHRSYFIVLFYPSAPPSSRVWNESIPTASANAE